MAKDVFDFVQGLRASGKPFAVATVVETTGSFSARTSSKAVIDETAMLEVDMNDEVLGAGVPCGGHMRVYVEPLLPRPTLWIMGHGRIGVS
jgi:xanthine dehydrogenase accessory factor